MFTGIVEEVGHVRRVEQDGGGRRLHIGASFAGSLRVDQSVAVNGACLTVVANDPASFEVVAVEETLRKTNLGRVEAGSSVNLERAMKLGDRLDGHLVQGHVDATGTIVDVESEETDRLYRVRYPSSLRPYLIPMGSITIDGVSLTIARLDEEVLTVAIIPHTIARTALDLNWERDATVNLEVDLIGKYVAQWMRSRTEGLIEP